MLVAVLGEQRDAKFRIKKFNVFVNIADVNSASTSSGLLRSQRRRLGLYGCHTKIWKKYQIKEHLLTTISSVETGRWNAKTKQKVAWPWTVNAQGKGTYFETKAQAVREVKRLQKAGVKSIDVGCMQINLAYHPDAFKSVEEAFDPEKTLNTGQNFWKTFMPTETMTGLKPPWPTIPAFPGRLRDIKRNWFQLMKWSSRLKTTWTQSCSEKLNSLKQKSLKLNLSMLRIKEESNRRLLKRPTRGVRQSWKSTGKTSKDRINKGLWQTIRQRTAFTGGL